MGKGIAIIGIILVLGIASVIGVKHYIDNLPKCLDSRIETVHHNAWTQFVISGKSTIPIFHQAYDSEEVICTSYETK